MTRWERWKTSGDPTPPLYLFGAMLVGFLAPVLGAYAAGSVGWRAWDAVRERTA